VGRLHELHPNQFTTLEGLGIAVVDAETDSQIAPLAQYFRDFGKTVFAAFDKQSEESLKSITATNCHAFESPEEKFETLIVEHSAIGALRRYSAAVVAAGTWPPHLQAQRPTPQTADPDLRAALGSFFKSKKGDGAAADFLEQCSQNEMPPYVVSLAASIRQIATQLEQSAVALEADDWLGAGTDTSLT
jgi:putative ATP-dependent endonuclease of OLD family